ncbi:MAG: hypothetical protein ABIL58_21810 [Pseudomonadota bacterium]
MKEQFKDILSLDDVKGVIVVGTNGQIVFQSFATAPAKPFTEQDFHKLIQGLSTVVEVELMYENIRLYIRKFAKGFVIIVMGRYALVSMVRLNCDILLSTLSSESEKPKGIGRFFKR